MDSVGIAAISVSGLGAIKGDALQYVGLGTVSLALLAMAMIVVLLKAALIGAALWLEATWPRLFARSVAYYHTRPWRCYIAGLVNAVVGILLSLLLIASGRLTLVGLLLAMLLVFLVVLGFATGYRAIARRLRPDEADTMGALLLGGIVTELVFLVPFIGQIYFVNMLLRGLGAATLALLSQRRLQPPKVE